MAGDIEKLKPQKSESGLAPEDREEIQKLAYFIWEHRISGNEDRQKEWAKNYSEMYGEDLQEDIFTGKHVRAVLRTAGINPEDGEKAEKFMREWDWNLAEKMYLAEKTGKSEPPGSPGKMPSPAVDAGPAKTVRKDRVSTPGLGLSAKKSENVKPIDQAQEIREMEEGKVYYSERKGREANLEAAFSAFEKDNRELLDRFQGKDVLIKVNLVDPDHPQACTHIESLRKVIEFVQKYSPQKIWVGDIPSQMGKKGRGEEERSWEDLKKVYENTLGYKFSGNVELLDMEKLEAVEIGEGQNKFSTKKLDQFGGIVNLSKPKMHGEFGYTGCTKNLMGFMNQETRTGFVHMREETGKGGKYDSHVAHKRLKLFSEAMLKYRPDMINISDGQSLVIGHEHIGPEVEANFSMVTRNPFTADSEAMKLFGLNEMRAEYLISAQFGWKEKKLAGRKSKSRIYPSQLKERQFGFGLDITDKGFNYSRIPIIDDARFLNSKGAKMAHLNFFINLINFDLKVAGKNDSMTPKKAAELVVRNKASYDNLVNDLKRVYGKYFEGAPGGLDGAFPYQSINNQEFQALVQEWLKDRE